MASPGYDPLHRLCCHRHHHHHCQHHHYHRRYCALHNHLIHCHCQGSRYVPPPLPQNPQSFIPFPISKNSNVEAAEYKEAENSAAQISQELEHLELDEEEDDEPVFVLTDEWREFFAKSEARRQLEKQQRKKGKK